ncbi:diguanylate cyclase [Achromobacter sp. 413638]|uniref:GGDEF domain-containing protein n=1 Tax=Achromobacter sp. 413638 TaxID=3342385 RepID=UPI00370BF5A7
MLRSAYALKSLERYFLILATGVVLPVSVLTGIVVQQNWRAYASTAAASTAFTAVRCTLQTMELVSAERGPMNAALGENLPVPPALLASLRDARERSDAKLAELLALYRAPLSPHGAKEFSNIQRIRQALAIARANADLAIDAPRGARSGQNVWSVVDGMVDVVPELRTGMVESIGIVMRNQSDASDMMALAILAGELREQAGLLGSTFTPALSRRRALNDADQLKIERVLGRIEELQTLIDARISSIPELRGTIAYMDMKHLYMGDGIAYIERLRELASRGPAGAGLTTREVADAYVPLMRSITQFRDFMLDRVEQRIAAQRASSVRVLLATLAAAAMLAAALLLSLSQFRKRVIRPFVQATRIIGAIADGGPVPAIPLDRYRGEINGMFSALSVLKDTAASKSRLESERDRLILDLATMAETDFLTGLLNRRAFERRFEETRERWRGADPVLAFILFDIDHFKSINDTYGHAAGDEALKVVAALSARNFRHADVVARVGGEEFAVLCHTSQPGQALEMAERMRQGIAQASVTSCDGRRFGMTASFGVSYVEWGSGAEHAETLFRRADELLYQAKMSGRNRVLLDRAD